MVKRVLSVCLIITMLLSLVCITSFAKSPQEDAVEKLVKSGVMSGYPDGSLGVSKNITRAEFTKMIVLCKKLKGENISLFRDVGPNDWACPYINAASKAGIIGGFGDDTFRPDEKITYEQAAKMVLSAFNPQELQYPLEVMTYAMDEGYFDHVPAILGKQATRGDVALLLYQTMECERIKVEDAKAEEKRREEKMKKQRNQANSCKDSKSDYDACPASPSDASGGTAGAPIIYCPPSQTPPTMPYENTEAYTFNSENIFKNTSTSPLSTFSIDVDTASYSNMRRFLLGGEVPPSGAIRTEELINYFDYKYPQPTDGTPFSVTTEVQSCPWNNKNMVAMVALKGKELASTERKPSNLVFLLDVSGSMYSKEKLPLVQQAMKLLVTQLDARDHVSIVTYAGDTGVVLDGASGSEKEKILDAIFDLEAGGSTAGAAGITLAYQMAEKNKVDGNNRIILCTDGDFNVGPTSDKELEDLISEKRGNGIFLSVLGFGMGNLKDNRMEMLADKGDGNYAYIDNLREAKKVLVDDMTKTIFTIAKDVKIQVEFNPKFVKQYRLIGYENRKLENEDFENDQKDAGDLGAGHTVTALYEIVLNDGVTSSDLRYQKTTSSNNDELMFVKLRYKDPDGTASKLIEKTVAMSGEKGTPSENYVFATAVAQMGMLLNESEFMGNTTLSGIISRAQSAMGEDRYGLRAEFVQLAGITQFIKYN